MQIFLLDSILCPPAGDGKYVVWLYPMGRGKKWKLYLHLRRKMYKLMHEAFSFPKPEILDQL